MISFFFFLPQRDKYNQSMDTVKQKFFSADQHKQKMENLASELHGKRSSERKRVEAVNSVQQQIANLERELQECQEKGLHIYDLIRDAI